MFCVASPPHLLVRSTAWESRPDLTSYTPVTNKIIFYKTFYQNWRWRYILKNLFEDIVKTALKNTNRQIAGVSLNPIIRNQIFYFLPNSEGGYGFSGVIM